MALEEAREYVHARMAELGLQDWRFAFDRAKTRAGSCDHASRTVTLSRHFVANSPTEAVRDICNHELAHALLPRSAGHGPAWRALAVSLGSRGERCHRYPFVEPRKLVACRCSAIATWRHRVGRSLRERVCKRCGCTPTVTDVDMDQFVFSETCASRP